MDFGLFDIKRFSLDSRRIIAEETLFLSMVAMGKVILKMGIAVCDAMQT